MSAVRSQRRYRRDNISLSGSFAVGAAIVSMAFCAYFVGLGRLWDGQTVFHPTIIQPGPTLVRAPH